MCNVVGVLETVVRKNFADPLHAKKLVWTKRLKVFCDGGQPIFRWVPRVILGGLAPQWGMTRFAVYWLGREFNFVVGEDKNGLYSGVKIR